MADTVDAGAPTIAKYWLSYMDQAIPSKAGQTQIAETKRAFYAGFMIANAILLQIGSDAISEDTGVEWLEALHVEGETFLAAVVAGRE